MVVLKCFLYLFKFSFFTYKSTNIAMVNTEIKINKELLESSLEETREQLLKEITHGAKDLNKLIELKITIGFLNNQIKRNNLQNN